MRKTRQRDKTKQRLRDKNFFSQQERRLLEDVPQDLLGISDREMERIFFNASELLEFHESEKAVQAFSLLCKLQPYVSDCWYGLGRAYFDNEQFQEALEAYLTAETIEPTRVEFYIGAIEACLQMKNLKEAHHIIQRLEHHRKSVENFSQHRSEIRHLKEQVNFPK